VLDVVTEQFQLYFNACTLHLFVAQYTPDQHTNNSNRGLFMRPQNTRLAQNILTSHRMYHIARLRPNNILIYFNLIILWNCNFNSLNFKNLCNLARYKIFETPWGWHRDVETCNCEHYIKRQCCDRHLCIGWLIWKQLQLGSPLISPNIHRVVGDRGSTVLRVLCYKSGGRWFDPSWCQWIFHWHKIFLIAKWPWGRLSL